MAGAVAHAVFAPGSLPVIGISAGGSAILLFCALSFPHAHVGLLIYLRTVTVHVWLFVLLWCGIQALNAGLSVMLSTQGGVANAAHLGGAAVGVVVWLASRGRSNATGIDSTHRTGTEESAGRRCGAVLGSTGVEEEGGVERQPYRDPGLRFAGVVLAVSLLPFLVSLFGVDFGVGRPGTGATTVDGAYGALTGPFIHTLFEWGALCIALFTALFGFLHHRVTRDTVTPVIGLALLASGLMDGFHILAADRLIPAADTADFIPFTWALCRLFNALILLVGAGLVLRRSESDGPPPARPLLGAAVGFGALALGAMVISAVSPDLPRTIFIERVYSRPWDLAPLAVYIFGAVWAFPLVHRRFGSTFSLALWISAIPHIATQLHAAFGSSTLYDSHFFLAHFLKVVAYFVPFVGLMLDYVHTHRKLAESEKALAVRADELKRTNAQLEEVAYAASQDMQQPLREVASYVDSIERHFRDQTGEVGAAYIQRASDASFRMQAMLNDLLLYMQIRRSGKDFGPTEMNEVVRRAQEAVRRAAEESGAKVAVSDLPSVQGDRGQLIRLVRSLLDNAIKFRSDRAPRIEITAREEPQRWVFDVKDNGIGMDPSKAHQIFDLFKRMGEEHKGTGIGLTISRFVVERHGGTLTFASAPGEGSTFTFSLRKGT